ncbi:MAG: TIGR03792 family protein [Synechococcaceae cyanobacterium]|nr:TIGR03792 family protein [Synechococcaceae cyanobacterium]
MDHLPPLTTITSGLVRLDATPAPGQDPSTTADARDPQAPLRIAEVATTEVATAEAAMPADGAIEVLRLRVPASQRRVWLEAERAVWEPWLLRQEGFLGRELFWDPALEQGVLVIRWASRRRWHAIPTDEVSRVHQAFQQHARARLRHAGHPVEDPVEGQDSATCPSAPDCFPLLHSSEAETAPPHPPTD